MDRDVEDRDSPESWREAYGQTQGDAGCARTGSRHGTMEEM